MADDWYHIAQTPNNGMHVHLMDAWTLSHYAAELMQADPELDSAEAVSMAVAHYAELIRADLGFAQVFGNGWSSAVSPGMPHPSTMARPDVTYHTELPTAKG